MRFFFLRFLLFLAPLIFVIFSYFCFDPFKVMYNYNDYYSNNFVQLNRDFISTETFLKKNPQHAYNSFIFGSSRTLAFKTKDWIQYLDIHAKPFVFDASNENIEGIESKFRLIDRTGNKIENVLIIICTDATFFQLPEKAEHVYIKHPSLSGKNKLFFQSKFLIAYLSNGFFIAYLDYTIFHRKRDYMIKNLTLGAGYADTITNDLFTGTEQEILQDSLAFYKINEYEFRKRNVGNEIIYQKKQINEPQYNALVSICRLLKKHMTNYKIVISPLFDKKKIHPDDLAILKHVFGDIHVFDYSGINEITKNKYNYFERSHYRYRVGKQIMNEIYSKKYEKR